MGPNTGLSGCVPEGALRCIPTTPLLSKVADLQHQGPDALNCAPPPLIGLGCGLSPTTPMYVPPPPSCTASVFRVLEVVHELVRTGRQATQRDVYYKVRHTAGRACITKWSEHSSTQPLLKLMSWLRHTPPRLIPRRSLHTKLGP